MHAPQARRKRYAEGIAVNSSAAANPTSQLVTITAREDPPPRVQIRLGTMRRTLTTDEAISFASELADAVQNLRAGCQHQHQPTRGTATMADQNYDDRAFMADMADMADDTLARLARLDGELDALSRQLKALDESRHTTSCT
jgi:hypothetical protein